MPLIACVLTFLAWTSPASATSTCVQNAEAVRTCYANWEKEFDSALKRTSDEMTKDRGLLVLEATLRSGTFNTSSRRLRACMESEVQFDQSCASDAERMFQEHVTQNLESVKQRVRDIQGAAKNTLFNLILQANLHLDKRVWALNCHRRTVRDENFYQLCFVVDRSSSEHRFVPVDQADSLPVTVGASDRCSFFQDGDGRIISADHCGPEHMRSAYLFETGTPFISALPANRLDFSEVAFESAPAMEDLAVFTPGKTSTGKPIYYLALDRSLENGCELRNNLIVACSVKSLSEVSGLRAEMASFPGTYYLGSEGKNRRTPPASVLRQWGNVSLEFSSERYFIQMYSQPGTSGAPVYLPAYSMISGVIYDRPLVLGPVSAYTGQVGQFGPDGLTDNFAVVAILNYSRLQKVLQPAEVDIAGAPLPAAN